METRKVDVAIIGAGTAGLNARRECEKAGVDWVIIEGGPFGTTCARVGCMPSKLLIAAAEKAHAIDGAAPFGVQVEDWSVDGAAVMARVQRERDRFAGFVVEATEGIGDEHLLRGHARFVGPTTLVVDDAIRVEAQRVVIATGSSPWIPPEYVEAAAQSKRLMTSDDLFEIKELPQSMAVVGTGVIGLELGQAMGRLGVDVSFFNPFDVLGPFSDPKVVHQAHQVFGKDLDLHLKTQMRAVTAGDEGVHLAWTTHNGVDHEKVFDTVLVAAGRRPNYEGLDLEAAQIPLDQRGAPVSDPRTTQVGQTPIFIAGDVSGHRPLLHEASDEGRIAGANAVGYPDVEARMRKPRLEIAFTDPQMAVVGKRYSELDLATTEIGSVSYANQGRARVMGINQGLVRLYGDMETCALVGAEMFGPRVEHMAHLLAWAIDNDEKVPELVGRPFYHPVFEEGIRTALRDLAKKLRLTGHCSPESFAETPGA